jgi:hypothetical protein
LVTYVSGLTGAQALIDAGACRILVERIAG